MMFFSTRYAYSVLYVWLFPVCFDEVILKELAAICGMLGAFLRIPRGSQWTLGIHGDPLGCPGFPGTSGIHRGSLDMPKGSQGCSGMLRIHKKSQDVARVSLGNPSGGPFVILGKSLGICVGTPSPLEGLRPSLH